MKSAKSAIVFAFIFSVLFSSCHRTPQQRAEQLIRGWVHENIADLKSYESIIISPVDSFFSSVENTELFKHYNEEFGRLQEENEALLALAEAVRPFAYYDAKSDAELRNYALQVKANAAEMGEYADSIRILEQSFVPEFLGFSADHKFRAKDKDGILAIYNYLFCFNKDITEIVTAVPYHE